MNDKEFNEFVEDLVKDYRGNGTELSRALGTLALGRQTGWRVIRLMESEATIRSHQKILGLVFKDVLPERGKYAHKSIGLALVDKWNNFWDVVQGRVKMPRNEKILFE